MWIFFGKKIYWKPAPESRQNPKSAETNPNEKPRNLVSGFLIERCMVKVANFSNRHVLSVSNLGTVFRLDWIKKISTALVSGFLIVRYMVKV